MKKIITLAGLIIAATGLTHAQFSRYIVQFTDKKGTPYSLTGASAYLSDKSIARRTKQHIAIDSTDLPVSPAWLDSIRKVPNVTVLYASKWLNQVLIQTTDPSALTKINTYPFVKKTNGIAPRVSTTADKPINKFEEEGLPMPVSGNRVQREMGIAAINYGLNYDQVHIHNGEYLHNRGFTGKGMTIAVLDAGFYSYQSNPVFDSVRLQGRILGTWDYVTNNASVNEDLDHGANVLSIMVANKPGSMVGTAPYASYWLLRTEDAATEYPVEEHYWAVAAEFADSAGVDVINTSLGYNIFDDPIFNYSYAQRNGNTAMSTIAADLAAKKGILVVVAAGNSGASTNDLKYVAVPADADSVLTVGSIDKYGNIASSSCWGPNGAELLKPNVVSVGAGAIYSAPSGVQVAGNGTSYACPNMAGLVTCLWQAFPEFSNMEIMDAVQKSASKYAGPDFRYGNGTPNFKTALFLLQQKFATSAISFNNCIVAVNWTSKDDTGSVYSIQRKLPGEADFTLIKKVPSSSLSFKANNYTWNDTLRSGGNGLAQYRIVQTEGTDTSFQIANLQQNLTTVCFPDNTLLVSPSPFDRQIMIVVNTPDPINNMGIQITDMSGRVVYTKKVNKAAGYYSSVVNTSFWRAGIYKVTLFNGNKRMFNRKVLKK